MSEQEAELLRLLEEENHAQRYHRLAYLWPNEGQFSRDKYPKHMELIKASATHHELAALGANGVGKSILGAGFTSILTTGRYPEWWNGYHVPRPVRWWVTGITKTEVRTSTQKYLLGDVAEKGMEYLGTGLLPLEDIVDVRFIPNSNKACDFATIRNRSGPGGFSIIRFKSYDQGKETFQAENLDGAWEDEEEPRHHLEIHSEIIQRFRAETREGRVLSTLTPINGKTPFIANAMNWRKANAEEGASRYTIHIAKRDVPHLTAEEIKRSRASTPANERLAREEGMPNIGTGVIYDVDEASYLIRPVRLEPHWRRGFGFDYGVHNTAFVYCAVDDDTDTIYVYKDYKDGNKSIATHAVAMKALGQWIPGVGDASAKDSDGAQVVAKYQNQAVRMTLAKKGAGSVMAGIDEVYERLSTGRIKIFSTCEKLMEEIRGYAFNAKGEVVKENDHCLDALRYFVWGGGLPRAITERRGSNIVYNEVNFG